MHETLAQEVKASGIKVTLVEPGAYATDFGKSETVLALKLPIGSSILVPSGLWLYCARRLAPIHH